MQRPDIRQVGEVAHERNDAVARFGGGGLDPWAVRTHREDRVKPASRSARAAAIPDGPLPPVTSTFNGRAGAHPAFSARAVAAARSWLLRVRGRR